MRLRRLVLLVSAALGATMAAALAIWGAPRKLYVERSTGRYELVAYWDGRGAASGPFEAPIGVAVAPSGDV